MSPAAPCFVTETLISLTWRSGKLVEIIEIKGHPLLTCLALSFSISQIKRVELLYVCGFSLIPFDANKLLKHFRSLKYLKIAYSNLTHINNDFPVIPTVEVVNITRTNLAFTRPSLFEKLDNLRILDLRRNKLDHMEGPLRFNKNKFQAMYLSGKMKFYPIIDILNPSIIFQETCGTARGT